MANLNDVDDDLEKILDDDDNYIGTQIVYRCSDCGIEVIVKESEEPPDTCDCGGDLLIVGEEVYDKAQDLDEEDSGPTETVILQDETGDVDVSDQTDENTGLLFDQSEDDEHIGGLEEKIEVEEAIEPETLEDLESEEEELTLDEELPGFEELSLEEEEE